MKRARVARFTDVTGWAAKRIIGVAWKTPTSKNQLLLRESAARALPGKRGL